MRKYLGLKMCMRQWQHRIRFGRRRATEPRLLQRCSYSPTTLRQPLASKPSVHWHRSGKLSSSFRSVSEARARPRRLGVRIRVPRPCLQRGPPGRRGRPPATRGPDSDWCSAARPGRRGAGQSAQPPLGRCPPAASATDRIGPAKDTASTMDSENTGPVAAAAGRTSRAVPLPVTRRATVPLQANRGAAPHCHRRQERHWRY